MSAEAEGRGAENGTSALERELRIAPVMTGGTSLAVWMGGITLELYRMVCSRDEPNGSSTIYRRLLELTQTRARVDVITGTSAGGLNGALLAAAWSRGLPSTRFASLRDVWLETGDIAKLVRPPSETDPPSLLKGDDYFYEQLRAVLGSWERETRSRPLPSQRDRPCDLQITVTTVAGEPVVPLRQDDYGQPIGELSHAQTVSFRFKHFRDDAWVDQLAMAARASASIPGVFEPAFLAVGESGSPRRPNLRGLTSFDASRWAIDGGVVVNLPLGEAIGRIFTQQAGGDARRVVLYIKPTPTVPDPRKADDPDEIPGIAQSLATALSAPRAEGVIADIDELRRHNQNVERRRAARRLLLLPGFLGPDLQVMAKRSWADYRILMARRSVSAMMSEVRPELGPELRAAQSEIEEALRTARGEWLPAEFRPDFARDEPHERPWKWGIAALEHSITVVLSLFAESLDLPEGSRATRRGIADQRIDVHRLLDETREIRRLDDAFWRDRFKRFAREFGLDKTPKEADKEQSDRQASATLSDPGRRLSKFRDWAQRAYTAWPLPDDAGEELNAQKQNLREDLAARLEAAADAAERTSIILAELLRIGRALAQALIRAEGYARGLAFKASSADATDVVALKKLRTEVLKATVGEEPADDVLGVELNEQSVTVLDQFGALIPETGDRDSCLGNLLALHVLESVLNGGPSRAEQHIELMQVSWDAPNLVDTGRTPEDKLTGPELGRLGAFMKRSWRANDWLWGRMDGAHRLVLLLLEPRRLRRLGLSRADVVPELKVAATTMATNKPGDDDFLTESWKNDQEFLRKAWERRRPEVEKELEYLDVNTLPIPTQLPRSADAVAATLQLAIAQEELGHVRDAVESTTAAGGLEPDLGLFRRRYDRETGDNTIRPPADRIEGLLQSMTIGSEGIGDEIGSDQLSRTVAQSAAVAVQAMSGARSGLPGVITGVLRPVRTPALTAYALVRSSLTATRTGLAVALVALATAGAIVGVRLAGVEVSPFILAAALVVLLAGVAVSLMRSRLWTGLIVLVPLVVLGLALLGGEDLGQVITDESPGQAVPWKRWVFLNPWNLLRLGAAVLLGYAGLRLFGSWRKHRRNRPDQSATAAEVATHDTDHRRLQRLTLVLALLAPFVLIAGTVAAEQVLGGTTDNARVRETSIDIAGWLEERKVATVALALIAIGVLVGMTTRVRRSWLRKPAERLRFHWRSDAGTPNPRPRPWHPFNTLSAGQHQIALIGMLAVFVASGIVVLVTNSWLRDHGGGIIPFEFAGDPNAGDFVSDWDDAGGLWIATSSVLIDYVFLIAYGIGSALLISRIKAVAIFAWMPIAAAIADGVENAALLQVIAGHVNIWADLARIAATTKFFLLAVSAPALVLALVCGARDLNRWLRGRLRQAK